MADINPQSDPALIDDAPDGLDAIRAMVEADPAAKAAYEDAALRKELVSFLVETRKSSGLTQKQVADTIGATEDNIKDVENGRVDPRFSTLQRIARALGYQLAVELDPTQE